MMPAVTLFAPFTGRVVAIEDVPDPVFAEKIVGDGMAVDPEEGLGVAPVDGELAVFVQGGHAFALRAQGLEIIVHAGIDTVKMEGKSFQKLALVGDQVSAGQPIVAFDLAAVRSAGYSSISPTVIANLPGGARLHKAETGTRVRAGIDTLMTVEW